MPGVAPGLTLPPGAGGTRARPLPGSAPTSARPDRPPPARQVGPARCPGVVGLRGAAPRRTSSGPAPAVHRFRQSGAWSRGQGRATAFAVAGAVRLGPAQDSARGPSRVFPRRITGTPRPRQGRRTAYARSGATGGGQPVSQRPVAHVPDPASGPAPWSSTWARASSTSVLACVWLTDRHPRRTRQLSCVIRQCHRGGRARGLDRIDQQPDRCGGGGPGGRREGGRPGRSLRAVSGRYTSTRSRRRSPRPRCGSIALWSW